MIILDTNVVSELIRRAPSPAVLKKVMGFPSDDIYTTVITEAEIRLGLAILPRGRKRTALQMQVDLILKEDFAGRILPFDSEAAQAYAKLVAERRTAGRPISLFDAQIAAIVQTRGAVLITRNARDFQGGRFEVINPWPPEPS
jgi:predicted nucleic acid-binding protein